MQNSRLLPYIIYLYANQQFVSGGGGVDSLDWEKEKNNINVEYSTG